jgi:hypothetical protein
MLHNALAICRGPDQAISDKRAMLSSPAKAILDQVATPSVPAKVILECAPEAVKLVQEISDLPAVVTALEIE